MRRILVIRLGALGDFFLSFSAFAAIRAHHAGDHLTLLTTAPFVAVARKSPWFDEVRVDTRPSWFDPLGLWRLRQQLRGFDFVYDLQTSRRSSRYFQLAGRPAWSGIARGASHPDADPGRNALHSVPRQRGQLAAAGVAALDKPVDISWLADAGPDLRGVYGLLVPGTSGSHGGAKTWPAANYAALAVRMAAGGIRPIVVGTAAEAQPAAAICGACPAALNLTGKTSIMELAGLASRAAVAVGGDTGPIHLAAVMGARVVALFSPFSDKVAAAPVGPSIVLQAAQVGDIGVAEVAAAVLNGGGRP